MSEHLTDSLNQRYQVTLALVAFLVLLNQLLVQPSLMRLTSDAPVINIAGRQRMLSQRLGQGRTGPGERRREGPAALLGRARPSSPALDRFPRRTAPWKSGDVDCRAATVRP